jgi:hypothetical protein
MSDAIRPPSDATWRLITPKDTPFVYYLVSKVDPRWWRFSRHGLEPSLLVATARGTAAGVIVIDGYGQNVACALLADTGASGTGMLEYFALPNPDAQTLARRFAHDLVGAAFAGTPIRQLYYERFENDPDVLGEVGALFEVEVTFPDFAMIDGRYETRTTSVLTADRFAAAQKVPQ